MKKIIWIRFVLILLGLTGCSTEMPSNFRWGRLPPTQVPLAQAPTRTPTVTVTTTSPPKNTPMPTTTAKATLPPPSPTATPPPPTPAGTGVPPAQTQQRFVPDTRPQDNPGLRPPLMAAPLSIHPDDHYWLTRPVASHFRNFGLEWYPFGNHVLRADRDPYRVHHGIDLPNEKGTPVLAAGDGTIIHIGVFPSPRNGVDYYGNTVIIKHDWQWLGQDVFTLYAHTLELFVEVGDHVEAEQLIAGVGSSGEVSNSHLHFEVRVGENHYGNTQNPGLWMVPYEGWGTLAGRFVDKNGDFITGANVTVTSLSLIAPEIQQHTYENDAVQPDAVWRENFVVADLPAGRYRLHVSVGDLAYQRTVIILPGRTSFEIIAAEEEVEIGD